MIPFNKPYMTGKELFYITEAHFGGKLAGDGPFTKQCHNWLEEQITCKKALLTHSCTAALEMSALLLNIKEGDEIIMPSYTFVSTANAFALRGGVPVFVDIREDTLNIDENLIEAAITEKTKAIVVVHYAGVGCEMDTIMAIANKHNIPVVEDAAQAIMAKYKGKALGSFGDLAALSFHETKNIISGEGGALLVNNDDYIMRSEIIREKGTDRSRFFRGQVDKYTWQDIGSSFLPGELISAFLWAQLEEADKINQTRLDAWNRYHELLIDMEKRDFLRRQYIPEHCEHNAHMYYIILSENIDRAKVLAHFKANDINAVFHYVPLHSAPAGERLGRVCGSLEKTDNLSSRLIRLPLYGQITAEEQTYICKILEEALQLG